MRFGVSYYPEQWPQDRWPIDADLMAEFGLDVVRLAEFAWSSYEPDRGRFHFDWLDRAIDTLVARGLQIVMCTPTATPPVWLARERPDILAVGPDGRRRAYGSRRHTCPTSAAYREEAQRIVGALMDRYAGHAEITAWQIDNETGNHDSARCWCDECHIAFSSWLERRYGTIDALNEAWGTAFWSMTYPDFEAVLLPVPTMTSHHPALRLAHARFASDQTVDFLSAQFAQIRAAVGDRVEITTNFYSEDTPVDQRAAARLGGVAAIDNYPHGPDDYLVTAYHLDLARWAAGPDGSAWVMEQQAGPINWTATNPPVPEGQVRVWTWQAAMHGCDTIMYFRWRAARYGQEMYHSGLLRHDGTVTAVAAEIADTIDELRSVDIPHPDPRVALVHSFDDVWAVEINPHVEGLTHRSIQMGAYRAARRLGFDVAIVDSTDDLTRYDIVLAPAMHITTTERVDSVRRALDAGTIVVLGPRSLVVDRDSAWSDRPLPGGLANDLGARVVETGSPPDGATVHPWGTSAGTWADILEIESADTVAIYGGSPHVDGRPAAVRSGGLVYAGFSDVASWSELLREISGRHEQPDHLEVFKRPAPGDRPDASWTITIDHHTLEVRTNKTPTS